MQGTNRSGASRVSTKHDSNPKMKCFPFAAYHTYQLWRRLVNEGGTLTERFSEIDSFSGASNYFFSQSVNHSTISGGLLVV